MKLGIKKRDIFCSTFRDDKGNLYYKFFFNGVNVPKFLFKGWAFEKYGVHFFIQKTEEQWPSYYPRLKKNPLITLEHEFFKDVVGDCVLEAL